MMTVIYISICIFFDQLLCALINSSHIKGIMSDPSSAENLVDTPERDKCLVLDSVKPATRNSHDSHWNQFVSFCEESSLHDPSEVTYEAPNHMAYCTATRFEGELNTGSCDNTRSAIRLHFKCFVKFSDG